MGIGTGELVLLAVTLLCLGLVVTLPVLLFRKLWSRNQRLARRVTSLEQRLDRSERLDV